MFEIGPAGGKRSAGSITVAAIAGRKGNP